MNYDWKIDVRPRSRAAASVTPPVTVDESTWDILLTLHLDDRCELSLEKLARVVSIPSQVLNQRLAELEQGQLITGVKNEVTNELRARLTPEGRRLLDQYLSATTGLQVGTHH
jgi:DNA-binding HxlR family transcriptional regulator